VTPTAQLGGPARDGMMVRRKLAMASVRHVRRLARRSGRPIAFISTALITRIAFEARFIIFLAVDGGLA